MDDDGVCAVVGVGPRLGSALVRRFGREGLRVAMLARSRRPLEDLRAQLAQEGVEAEAFAADAGSAESLASAFGAIRERMGAPRILLYNAAGMHAGTASGLDPGELAEDLRTSVVGALAAAREVLPQMLAAGRGTVLFTGSGAALRPSRTFASLSVTKAALRSLALSLAAEHEGTGVRVGTVTVAGTIGRTDRLAPERIAEAFWSLHASPEAEPELVYR